MDYKSIMQRELQAAKAIAAKADAEKRELTPGEIEKAGEHLKAFNDAKSALAAGASQEGRGGFKSSTVAQLDAIGFTFGGGAEQKGVGFKARAGSAWAAKAADIFQKVMASPDGAKALISGTIDVPSVIAEPVELLGRPTSILDLIPKRKNTEQGRGNAFSYLRQTTRTNNAGPVADNATKPTSVYTFGDVEDTFRVYAHLSEAFPKRYLDDYNGLIAILQGQMGAGLMEALEEDVLSGAVQPQDGFTGILNTSGIQAQAWATDMLTTLSNARYKLINSFQTPNAWVLNPDDVQQLELIREDGATGPFLFRNGLTDIEDFLGGYPIVMSNLMTAGTALLGDFEQTELIIREDDHLDVDTTGGDKFAKNQVQFRLEGRYGFTVERPLAFVEADITDPS